MAIDLFIGKRRHRKTVVVKNTSYMNYFQSEETTNILYNHLQDKKRNIIDKNPFKERYNNNNDIFIHIRLTDAKKWNPGIAYYLHCINLIEYDNIYMIIKI